MTPPLDVNVCPSLPCLHVDAAGPPQNRQGVPRAVKPHVLLRSGTETFVLEDLPTVDEATLLEEVAGEDADAHGED